MVKSPHEIERCIFSHGTHSRLCLLEAFQHLSDIAEWRSRNRRCKFQRIHLHGFSNNLRVCALHGAKDEGSHSKNQHHDGKADNEKAVAHLHEGSEVK